MIIFLPLSEEVPKIKKKPSKIVSNKLHEGFNSQTNSIISSFIVRKLQKILLICSFNLDYYLFHFLYYKIFLSSSTTPQKSFPQVFHRVDKNSVHFPIARTAAKNRGRVHSCTIARNRPCTVVITYLTEKQEIFTSLIGFGLIARKLI